MARRAALVALKVLARSKDRPQDDFDLSALIPQLDGPEVSEVEDLLRQVTARGYARGKKLIQEFRRLTRRWKA